MAHKGLDGAAKPEDSGVMQIRLHSRYQNSAGERVRIVLNLKGIAYDYVVAPAVGSAAYRSINPQGLLPTLEIDGRFVAQSMAIIELIEELHPEPAMLPADPFERARMRAFAQHIAADLHPINNRRIRTYLVPGWGSRSRQSRPGTTIGSPKPSGRSKLTWPAGR